MEHWLKHQRDMKLRKRREKYRNILCFYLKKENDLIWDGDRKCLSTVWEKVYPQLFLMHQLEVCVYDRAGLGFSDLPFVNEIDRTRKTEQRQFVSQVATVEQMTCDLHHLVTNAKPLARPFILVGSETGALIARHYGLTYPGDVSDIVLLNPLIEDLFWRQKRRLE
ncbi:uncharacterized protein CEXT_140661 [Caerostris extrusa]|uniref:Serine aminopeptidase S33 domain-containing protein n=1 Tax=Caerostris extrusa TaxID=172846 RepID=A0AAV4VDA9_CAEEX|nr:uncharacterized protein CEXT_140661 [Caerostris extrusa]